MTDGEAFMRFARYSGLVLCCLIGAGCESAEQPAKNEVLSQTQTTRSQTSSNSGNEHSLPFHAIGPVARIDDTEISPELYNELVARTAPSISHLPPSALVRYREHLLDQLIRARLLEDAAIKSGVEVSDRDLLAEVEKLRVLADAEDAPKDLRTQAVTALTGRAVLAKYGSFDVTDAELRTHYDENRQEYVVPANIRVSQIVLKVPPAASDAQRRKVEAEADAIANEARRPDSDFAALARKHSQGPLASQGGNLGHLSAAKSPTIASAVSQMEVGDVSNPLVSPLAVRILKLHERTPEKQLSFEEAAPLIRSKLATPRMMVALHKFVDEQKKSRTIVKMLDNVKFGGPR